ncbi:mRNA decay activator protein ZFP36L2 [Spea bombifrons]|uniref:mRNA decay activator protein ZFP36L2 n=1 Tax=Spea bombifrons TaxID=233779 RepID=UPI00234ACA50|nr:mRNA decay activator protein ZFP36L2 [Spea bombifrons]
MSATLLSAFYDIELFCKNEKVLNNLNLSNMLDKKAVGSPVSSPNSNFIPGFLRRHSASNLQALSNNNSPPKFCSNHLKEPSGSTALMNKENKFRDRSFSENGERSQHLLHLQQQQQQHKSGAQINSTRYKTELCRPFEESGACKYGEKCQFAHGYHELRSLTRHPKYKTELCRTFHTIGFCPYGPRCHFIHNAEERRQAPGDAFNCQRPKLHHSLSFSGFSNHGLDSPLLESPTSRTPPPQSSGSLYCDEAAPCANNAFTFSGQELGLITPLAIQTHNLSTFHPAAFCRQQSTSSSPPPTINFQPLRRLSESPVFDNPPSPPESLSDPESYLSGSLSSGSLSGSDSPTLDSNRRLPIFSRLSISDD